MRADSEFDRLLAEAVAAPFSGWDFSWLEGRRVEEGADDWDYEERARKLIQTVASLLDVGTGGGERLSQLGPFPPRAIATEAYGPNVPVATRRLQPLGITIVQTHPGVHDTRGPQPDGSFPERRLPFPDASFELVLAHRGLPRASPRRDAADRARRALPSHEVRNELLMSLSREKSSKASLV